MPDPKPAEPPRPNEATTDLPVPAADSAEFPFLRPPDASDPACRLGPYRVLGVLGRGGMGVVFEAEDPHLDRRVALKALLPNVSASPTARSRFLREARLQAKVQHEHVAAIFQVGEDRGTPFLAMPLLKGLPLVDALKANPRPPLAEGVRIAREIAEGLAAAHAVGLVHRDIKPGNVWLEAPRLRVKILDFGLARLADEDGTGSEAVTRAGGIVGTPAYMSPEQAWGNPVDHRTDLFSLGVVLYEMCAGERPFAGKNPREIMTRLTVEEPLPVAERNPAVPSLLAGLIGRLLAKDPAGRPATAVQVADELQQIEASLRAGVRVVPHGPLPLPVAVPVPVGADPFAEIDATLQNTVATVPVRAPAPRWIWPAVGGLAAVTALALVVAAALPKKKPEEPTAAPEPPKPKPAFPPPPKKDAEKQNLPREVRSIALPSEALNLAMTADGKLVAAGCQDGVIYLIDPAAGTITGQLTTPALGVCFSPDGRWLVSVAGTGGTDDAGAGGTHVWDVKEKKLHRKLEREGGWGVAVSPVDGTVFARESKFGCNPETGEVRVRLHDAIEKLGGGAAATVLPRSGLLFAPGGWGRGHYGLTDPRTGAVVARGEWNGRNNHRNMAASPDGKRVAMVCGSGGKWDTKRQPHVGPENAVEVFDVDAGKVVLTMTGHAQTVWGVAYSPQGDRIASAGWDDTVRVWDAVTGAELHVLRGHTRSVNGVAFGPDGRTLVSAGYDRTVRVWELPPGPADNGQMWGMLIDGTPALSVALTADGKLGAAGAMSGVFLFDPTDGRKFGTLKGVAGNALAFSPDGRRLATQGGNQAVRLWDVKTRALHREWTVANSPVPRWSVAFTPDGSLLVGTGGRAGWDPETGEEKVRFENPLGSLLGFVGSNRLLDHHKSEACAFDAATGKRAESFPRQGSEPRGLAVAPDGKSVAVATGPAADSKSDTNPGSDNTVWVLDTATGKELLRLTGHESTTIAVAYSRDGTRIASTGLDRTVRVWDAKTGAPVAVFRGHTGAGQGVAFLPGEQALLSAALDGTVRLWRLPPPK